MNPRIILDPTVYVHSRTPLYKTLQWRFPKIGGTSKSSMLVSDLPWNKHFSINHPAIEVPPWLWTPPLIVPSRGCPSLSIDLTSAFDVDAWIHGFKPTESQKNPRKIPETLVFLLDVFTFEHPFFRGYEWILWGWITFHMLGYTVQSTHRQRVLGSKFFQKWVQYGSKCWCPKLWLM